MLILAIETSGKAGSIALHNAGVALQHLELSATGRRHARTLIPEINHLLKSYNFTPSDVNLVAVSIGPGSFTGLRVGIVCAKTFAYAVGCNIIGVDTFLAIAAASPKNVNEVWVIEDALRGDLFAGKYVRHDQTWTCAINAKLIALEAWLPQVGETLVTGPGVTKHKDLLTNAYLSDEQLRDPQATWIAHVGEQLFNSGQKDDPWTLMPHYMRRSAAEEQADNKQTTSSL